MKKVSLVCTVAVFSLVAACVTINIYFPAEEVRSAADRIVNEVWGEGDAQTPPSQPEAPAETGPTSLLQLIGPSAAWAADGVNGADINISTPQIRAIKNAMRQRTGDLRPYLDGGQIGVGRDGLLKVRTLEGLDLRGRGAVQRLVKAENQDRMRLYSEIAAEINQNPNRTATPAQVQEIFAESWQSQAAAGWYIETATGSWRRK
ncbi:MAG: hypothetical protein PWP34_672 [Desulfuromonadales bacterium]|jgi:uncharacterized protein YdbL (DUF1318 family)|nr:hypothetical protein [Desulfuromonadales bacterium]